MSGDLPKEPTFLRDLPSDVPKPASPPAKPAAAPPPPTAPRSESSPLLAAMAAAIPGGAAAATPETVRGVDPAFFRSFLAMLRTDAGLRNGFTALRRDRVQTAFHVAPPPDAGWRGAWVEERLGGLRVSAPGHWRFQRDDQGAAWDLPGGALMTVMMVGFEKRAPDVDAHAGFMLSTDRHGHECVGRAPIAHPRGAPEGTAVAFVEHDPTQRAWPQRWYRLAAWGGNAILLCKLDIDGLPDPAMLADVDAFWRRLV